MNSRSHAKMRKLLVERTLDAMFAGGLWFHVVMAKSYAKGNAVRYKGTVDSDVGFEIVLSESALICMISFSTNRMTHDRLMREIDWLREHGDRSPYLINEEGNCLYLKFQVPVSDFQAVSFRNCFEQSLLGMALINVSLCSAC